MPDTSTATSRPPSALIFDLDGTLVNSSLDLTNAVNRMRHDLGLEALTHAAVTRMIGDGARKLVERALPPSRHAELGEAVAKFMEHYRAVCTDQVVAYDGIVPALEVLARRWPLAVLTNKPQAMVGPILDHVGVAKFLKIFIGGDTLPTRKPDPTGLKKIADVLRAPVSEVVLVGDSHVDASTAKNAGCRFAFCEWGFGLEAEVFTPDLAGVVDARLKSPAHLLQWLGVA